MTCGRCCRLVIACGCYILELLTLSFTRPHPPLLEAVPMHLLSKCHPQRWRLSLSVRVMPINLNGIQRFATAATTQPRMVEDVRTTASATFQRLLTLHNQSSGLTQPGALLVEGRTIIQHLATSPWILANLILTQQTLDKEFERQTRSQPHLLSLITHPAAPATATHRPRLLQLTPRLLHRLSNVATPSEYMAEFILPHATVVNAATAAIRASGSCATVVLDGVSDPTNVASLLRSAHAFGFHRLVATAGSCSFYNRKVIAGSAGSIAYMHIQQWDEQLIAELKTAREQGRVCVIGLVAADGSSLRDVAASVTQRRLIVQSLSVWLVVGNESHGVSPDMLQWCDELCTIPMSSEVESLNVAVAASIACYELCDQSAMQRRT